MLRYKTVRRTTLIGLGCASFLIGLGLVKLGADLSGWQWLFIASCLLGCCFKKKLLLAVPAVITAGMLLGIWQGSATTTKLEVYDTYVGNKVTLSGVVVDDAVYNDKGQRDFRLNLINMHGRSPPGQVRVTTFSFVEPRRGDVVQVRGKLMDGFGNYQAAIYYGEVIPLAENDSWVEQLRRQFAAAVYSYVPEPQASLGLGFLVGLRSQLPDDLHEQLQLVGLTHIVVASGYNLTILIRLARRLFEKRSKYQTALVSVTLMVGFVAVTGFSPSMTRAALVTGLALAAWYFGRRIHPVVLLLVAAAITAGFNPLYLWGDIGWWLSFLAFAGVMLLAPLLQKRLFGEREPKLLGQVVLETLSAQVATLPLIAATFGSLSLISLPANILMVPLVPLAMLLTFIAGMAGLIAGALAPYIALPATWLLTYMTEGIGLLATISWATIQVALPPFVMIWFYGVLLVVGIVLWHKTGHDYLSRSVVE